MAGELIPIRRKEVVVVYTNGPYEGGGVNDTSVSSLLLVEGNFIVRGGKEGNAKVLCHL
jgi:hypothetical protein